jgi:shikimate kinase
MGAGKSAVARRLAARLGEAARDLDAWIESVQGAGVPELFARHGEAWFRTREAEALETAVAEGAGVVACGGGIVTLEAARETLRRRCRTVWLEVTPAEAARRVGTGGAGRPLLAGGAVEDRLTALLDRRAPLYAEVAELRVPTDGLDPDEVAHRIATVLGATR